MKESKIKSHNLATERMEKVKAEKRKRKDTGIRMVKCKDKWLKNK